MFKACYVTYFYYQHVSIAFAISVRVFIQEYKKYNILLNYVSNHLMLRCNVVWFLYIEFTYYTILNIPLMHWYGTY